MIRPKCPKGCDCDEVLYSAQHAQEYEHPAPHPAPQYTQQHSLQPQCYLPSLSQVLPGNVQRQQPTSMFPPLLGGMGNFPPHAPPPTSGFPPLPLAFPPLSQQQQQVVRPNCPYGPQCVLAMTSQIHKDGFNHNVELPVCPNVICTAMLNDPAHCLTHKHIPICQNILQVCISLGTKALVFYSLFLCFRLEYAISPIRNTSKNSLILIPLSYRAAQTAVNASLIVVIGATGHGIYTSASLNALPRLSLPPFLLSRRKSSEYKPAPLRPPAQPPLLGFLQRECLL